MNQLSRNIKRFFSNNNQPFKIYLQSKQIELQIKRSSNRKSQLIQISVPRLKISRQSVMNYLQNKNIKNKNVFINVDYSHLIGTKRYLTKLYQQKNVYKGLGSPTNLYTKDNPSIFTDIQQLKFDQSIFALTDSQYLKLDQNIEQQKRFEIIQNIYKQNRNRGGYRLQLQYSIPSNFISIIQAAHNLQNNIYFYGLNQYSFRMILGASLKLSEAKLLYMECLNYFISTPIQQTNQLILEKLFQQKSKQYTWCQHYSLLQPISNQILRNMKRKMKGFYFAQSYNFITPENAPIDFTKLKDLQNDSQKIQKHAIFSAIFGNIWNKKYTNNPFPYLAQSYFSLSQSDKNGVKQIYNQYYNKYEIGKKHFFKKFKQVQKTM